MAVGLGLETRVGTPPVEVEMLKRGWLFGWVGLLAACGVDIESGQQLAGQRCFMPSDCSTGLTCYNRTCVPYGEDGNVNNVNNANNANNDVDAGLDATDPLNNVIPECRPDERRCIDDRTIELCAAENGEARIVRIECGDRELCRQGDCVLVDGCVDADGDGYFAISMQCNDPRIDCDDRNARANPSARESCSTPFDDNCNGVVNENCNPDACCAAGCGPEEFCNADCACQFYDPSVCKAQNQPCFNLESFDNGFYCAQLGQSSEGRCYGICRPTAADPNGTCPDPNSTCTFGDDNGGICASNCSLDAGCGEPGLGCLPIGSSDTGGVCLPTNPDNQLNESCDPDAFLDCADGLICVPRPNGNGGVCREACRPFVYPNGSTNTDCGQGHCMPFTADIGICVNDNQSQEGERCQPQATTCGEDAVGCYPSGGGNRCQKVCRLELGSIDCDPGLQCFQFSANQPELGVCVRQQ